LKIQHFTSETRTHALNIGLVLATVSGHPSS
jgi:hypothetical protein